MASNNTEIEARIDRLHAPGVVDMHFDMLMDLYDKRDRSGVLEADYLPDLDAGGVGILGAAIYIEDKYLPEMGLRVALDQIARLYAEVDGTERFAICRSHADIVAARAKSQVALLITMEGVEPLGADLDLLRVFYELGLRSVGLTHARRNMAGDGGIFAPRGSSQHGITEFGRAVLAGCGSLGILIDLAHLNPAGVDEVLADASGPLIISHTTPRQFFDIERNSSADQIRAVGRLGGVVGANAALVGPSAEATTLDRYADAIEYMVELAGADGVGIGFDFFDFIYRRWSPQQRAELEAHLAPAHFVPDLYNHGHARNLTRKLLERGFADADIAKILYGNWMRVFEQVLR